MARRSYMPEQIIDKKEKYIYNLSAISNENEI